MLFIVTQPYANTISDEEIVQAIPKHLKDIHYEVVPIDINTGDLSKLKEVDFVDMKNRQVQQFLNVLKNKLTAKPNRHVLYVGKAPIPLAVHLGSLVESFEKTDSSFQRHRTNEWYFDPQPDSATEVEVIEPVGSSQAPGDIIVKIETSYSIVDSEISKTISQPLASYTLKTNKIEPDCMNGPLAKIFVNKLLEVLASIHKNYPNRTATHFFMSVPMGLAFEIGAALNPTIHYPIVTYQYFRGQESPYRKAILLGGDGSIATELSNAEKDSVKETISIWKQELSALQALSTSLKEEKATQSALNWIERLFPGHGLGNKLDSNFRQQISIADSAVNEYSMADSFDETGIEFVFEPKDKKWIIGDYLGYHFWAASGHDSVKLGPLIRLFLLHEAIHSERQRLHTENSNNIGRFARVLEEIDYQADIWAICHEFYYALRIQRVSTPPRKLAMELIETILNSFMAFDKASGFRDGFQVRRLNRYLLWLWQYILLTEARNEITAENVIEILMNKPVIDLAGPQIICRNERIFMSLALAKLVVPEVAIYYEGAFSRHEGSPAVKIFEGLDEFNMEKMLTGLREIYHKVRK